ncbi:hypothetical protein OC844_006438, partial [Tilletia horrida]
MASTSRLNKPTRSELELQAQTRRSKLRDALQALTQEESAAHLEALRKQLAIAEDTITNSIQAERVRLNVLADYEAYTDIAFPGNQAWTSDAEQLYQQLAGFLQFKVTATQPRGKADEKVQARTVTTWSSILQTGVVQRLEADAPALAAIVRGKKLDRSDGLSFRLRRFVASLVDEYDLQRHAHDRIFYGRAELNILLFYIEERALASPLNFASTLQLAIQLLIAFFSGVRPSSLARYSPSSGYLRVDDIRIIQGQRFDYTVEINIKNIKKFNGALSKGMSQLWIFRPITKVQNATLDLAAWLIPFLVDRGVLHDTNGPIKTMAHFIASDSASFACTSGAPLFLASEPGQGTLVEGRPQTSGKLSNNFSAACLQAGLPAAGVYAFRHDVGNFFYAAMGREHARIALGHGLEGDITRSSYTRSTAMLDVVGMRTEGEPLGEEMAERLRMSNEVFLRLDGFGVRAMAQRIKKSATGAGQTVSARRKVGKRLADPAELSKEQLSAIEEDEALVQRKNAVAEAEAALDSALDEAELPHLNIKTILASADLPSAIQQLAALVRDRRDEATSLRRRLRKNAKRKKEAKVSAERLAKAGVSVGELQEASKEVATASNELARLLLGRIAGTGKTSIDPAAEPQAEDNQDADQPDEDLVDLANHFYNDSNEEEDRQAAEDLLDVGPIGEATTLDVKVALMRLNYGRLQGRKRLMSYVDVVDKNPWSRCPLCPLPGLTDQFIGTNREPGKITGDTSIKLRHLREAHPDEYAVLACGDRLPASSSFLPGTH